MTDVLRQIVDNIDGVAITTTQDVEPYLDYNKAAQNDGTKGYTPSGDMKRVASIPLVVAEKWLNDYGVDVLNPDHLPAVRKLLNDPDWRWLRTSLGQV